jgi:hypothetical protein
MSNVVFSAGWRNLWREAVAGWVALTAGAVLFAVVATVASRFGVGRDPAMAIALIAAGPAAVWFLLWILDTGVTSRQSSQRWDLHVHFAIGTCMALAVIVLVFDWLKADPVYHELLMTIATAYMIVSQCLLFIASRQFSREIKRLEAVQLRRRTLVLKALRNVEQRELNILWMVSREGEKGAAVAASLSPEETHAVYQRAVEKFESSLDEIPAA